MALTACGGGKTSEKDDAPELLWYISASAQNDAQLVNDAVNELVKEKLGFTVKIKMLDPSAYTQKMNMIISTKEEYDLCWTSPQSNDYYNNIARNAFVPLDDLLEEYGKGTKALLSEQMWEATRVNGKIYGLINNQIMATAYGFAVQRPIANAAGMKWAELTHYTQLEGILKYAKENHPDKIPLSYNVNQEPFSSALPMFGFEAIGGNKIPGAFVRVGDGYQVVNQYETEEFKSFIATMHDWYKKGYIKSDASTSQEFSSDSAAGKFVVQFPVFLTGDTTISDLTPDEPYGGTGVPHYAKRFINEIITTDRATATMTAISSTSKYPEKAMQLIELINTDEVVYNTLCIGIEGKHYNKVEPYTNHLGTEVSIEKIDNSGYAPMRNWMFGNTALEWKTKADYPTSKWQNENKNAEISRILGFTFEAKPVTNEIAMCSNVIDEYLASLTSGSIEPTQRYEEFIAKLKTVGADKIVAEKQAQLDKWVASK